MTVALNEPKYTIEPSDYRCASCTAEVPAEAPFFSAVFFEGEIFRRRSFCPECWMQRPPSIEEAYAFWRSRRPAPQAPSRRLRFDADLILEFFRRLGRDAEEGAATASAGAPAPGGPPAGSPESPPPPEAASPGAAGSPEPGTAPPAAAPPAAAPPAAAPPAAAPPAAGRGEKVRLRLVLALLLIRRKTLIFESSAARDGREWLKLSEKADPEKIYHVENPPLSDQELEAVKVSLGELLQMDLG